MLEVIPMIDNVFIEDFIYGTILFIFIIIVVYSTKKYRNIWINRKIIHLSSVPAVLFYMYFFREPYVFLIYSIVFTVMLFSKHVKKSLDGWYQVEGNLGEVYFTLSYGVLSIVAWPEYKILAGVAMLYMAVGDSVTGIVRSRFVDRWQKHWTGSIAMLIATLFIGIYLLGYRGIPLALIATVAEAQPYIDDNLTVPLLTFLVGLLLV